MRERGVSVVFSEFAKDLFLKEPDFEVVRSVVELLNPALEEIVKIMPDSKHANEYSELNYFDICLAPRLNVINILELDAEKRFEAYLDSLRKNDIWKDVSSQDFEMKFSEYKEAL